MGTLDDWTNFVKVCISDDRVDLIAHRLYHLETEKDKFMEALQACKSAIDQSLEKKESTEVK